MATCTTQYPGNLALQTEVWTLTRKEARRVIDGDGVTPPLLDTSRGSYWETNLLKPYRRACRAQTPTVTIFTAGFSSGELSNALYAAGQTTNAESQAGKPASCGQGNHARDSENDILFSRSSSMKAYGVDRKDQG